MSSFRIPFNIDNQIQYLRITALEGRVFALHLESFGEESAANTLVPAPPDLLLQRSKTGNWTILDQGNIQLDAADLKRLGRYIEDALPFQV